MVTLLVAGQLVEREFRRRRAAADRPGAEYAALLAPLDDATLPQPRGQTGRGVTGGHPAPASRLGAAKTYVIQPGDTLAKIARKLYGSEARWKLLYDRNRAAIPDPARLEVGRTLDVPPADATGEAPRAKPRGSERR
jgi:nucleoid-associated protein YgaU